MDERQPPEKKKPAGDAAKIKSKGPPIIDKTTSSNTPRKRVSQACDRCRSRKDKCDGKKPICSTCAGLGQICSYDPSTKKRGLPEGYVRGMEKLWGLTIRDAPDVETKVISLLDDGDDQSRLFKLWSERDDSGDTLLETWRKSRISRELERLLPILELADDKNGKRKRHEAGNPGSLDATTPRDIFRRLDSQSFAGSTAETEDFRIKPPGMTAHHDQSNKDTRIGKLQQQLPSGAWHLIDVFFSYTHSWLPILEKHTILKTSYQYPTPVSSSTVGSGDHAALWAIFAYADHQRIVSKKPQVSETEDQWSVGEFYQHARSLIPTEEFDCELGHVQALLILTLINMGQDDWKRAWLLVGHAVRIAIDLGLGEGTYERNAAKGSDKKSRSKHTFMGCFALDTLISARMRRTPHLRSDNAIRAGRVEEDDAEEWDSWTDCLNTRRSSTGISRGPASVLSTFNNFIEIMKVLNTNITTKGEGVQLALAKELSTSCPPLPAQFEAGQIPLDKPGQSFLPHHYHLYLAQITTKAALGNVDAEGLQTSLAYEQASRVLSRHNEDYGLLLVPPTYDCLLRLINIENGSIAQRLIYQHDVKLHHTLSSMSGSWPVFGQESPIKNATYRHSSLHFPGGLKNSVLPIQDRASFQGFALRAPLAQSEPSIADDAFAGYDDTVSLPGLPMSNSTHTTDQFHQFLGIPPSPIIQSRALNNTTWPMASPNESLFTGQAIANQLSLQQHGSTGSDIDGDSTFNEFATLDAMEWTNNWDQSLLNLGFTDPDNMNRDFYALTREPDPLYNNNLAVQQLLSNSNPEPRVPTYNEAFFGLSNPHVEASQILQQLSAGEDHNLPS